MVHILVFTNTAVIIAMIYEQRHWNRNCARQIKELESNVALIRSMIVRSPELREIISKAPEDLFNFKKLR